MEVICISSDSENSVPVEEVKKPKESSLSSNINDDIYVVDWNDDLYPSIIYNSDEKNKFDNCSSPEKTINYKENLLTPLNYENIFQDNIQNIENKSVSSSNEVDNDSSVTEENYPITISPVSDWIFKKDCKNICTKFQKKKKLNKKILGIKEDIKALKEQKKLEKEKLKEEKRAEQEKQKAFKAVLSGNQKNLKPEENIKFLKVHIDNEIINSVCGGSIISVLQQNSIQYVVEAQLKSNTISWSKRRIEKEINNLGKVSEKIVSKEEEQLLYVIDWKNAVELIHNNELLCHIEIVKSAYIDKKLTLIIYGLQKYLNFKNNRKHQQLSGNKLKKLTQSERELDNAPNITKDQLEIVLTELQLLGKHNYRLLDTPEELSGLVFNITKSLSQLDYKLDKQKRAEDDFDWYARGDSQGVKVDKNGTGLLNLWQQQICQFNNVSLEAAQAIVSNYNSPLSLVNKYEICKSKEEKEFLLQNIQIRRDAGILSTTKRVGPQLSKKIFNFLTSDDPDLEL